MSRQKTYKKALNCRLDGNIWDILDAYCEETGLTKTKAVEKAIMKYAEIHKQEQKALTNSKTKK